MVLGGGIFQDVRGHDREQYREGRAGTRCAANRDVALHGLRESRADGESEPGPALTACRRAVELSECHEQLGEILRLNPLSFVVDGDLDPGAGVRIGSGIGDQALPRGSAHGALLLQRERHGSSFRELERVGGEIGDDLLDACGIPEHGRRVAVETHADLTYAVAGDGHESAAAACRGSRRDRRSALQL